MEAPDFWDDPEKATAKTRELGSLKDDLTTYKSLTDGYEEIETYIEMAAAEDDETAAELYEEASEAFDKFKASYEAIRLKTLLSGEYDHESAIVTLHSGAGGTEA